MQYREISRYNHLHGVYYFVMNHHRHIMEPCCATDFNTAFGGLIDQLHCSESFWLIPGVDHND